jgi:hypothetical protein
MHKLAENIVHTFKFYYTDLDNVNDLQHEVVCFLIERLHLFSHSTYIDKQLVKIINKEFREGYETGSFKRYTNEAPTITQEQIDTFIRDLKLSSTCLDKVSKLHPPKAYSYFGTIAKRYLITYNNKQYKLQKDRKEMDTVDEDKKMISASQEVLTTHDTSHFVKSYIQFVEDHINDIHENDIIVEGKPTVELVAFSEPDKDIVYTVLGLFKNVDEIPDAGFYKPALYLQIRQQTGQKTIDVTRVIRILKSIMKRQATVYYQVGGLDIDEPDIYIQ